MGEDLIIAVDGPGGVGKSTVSRQVAAHFGLAHLDTGAFYRAAALAVLEAGVELDDADGASAVVANCTIGYKDGETTLDGADVSRVIRSEAITSAVSPVAAMPDVRVMMVDRQRAWVDARDRRAVVEGRDIGSVVFPDAVLKVYLTADPEERARRRAGESGGATSSVKEALARRDQIDSTRAVSPLSIADGAVIIDTTHLTLPEVVDLVIAEVTARVG